MARDDGKADVHHRRIPLHCDLTPRLVVIRRLVNEGRDVYDGDHSRRGLFHFLARTLGQDVADAHDGLSWAGAEHLGHRRG